MPYSGPGDASLPSNVKKMPAKKRRRWVAIFNSTFKNCRSRSQGGGKGALKRCETMAFRFANGAVKELTMKNTLLVLEKMRKSYGDGEDNAEKVEVVEAVLADLRQQEETETECDCEVKEGEKCPHDMIALAPKPLGGSTSFSDHDEYQDAIDTEMHVKELGYIFRMLVDNIFENEEMSLAQKADAVVAAATELSSRVKAPPEGRRSLLDKMKDLVKGVFATGEGVDPQVVKRNFVSYKDAQGTWRWLIVNTNKYEVLSLPSLKSFEDGRSSLVNFLLTNIFNATPAQMPEFRQLHRTALSLFQPHNKSRILHLVVHLHHQILALHKRLTASPGLTKPTCSPIGGPLGRVNRRALYNIMPQTPHPPNNLGFASVGDRASGSDDF